MKTKDLLQLALLAGLAYVVYQALQGAGAVSKSAQEVYTATRGAVADTLYDLFGPTETFGPDKFFIITFVEPGAPRHSIAANQIARDGTFIYDGVQYKIYNNAQGQHFAARVS
jgi:hypothetical protein